MKSTIQLWGGTGYLHDYGPQMLPGVQGAIPEANLISIALAEAPNAADLRGRPQNRWFIMENPTRMDDLGVPFFQHTSKLATVCFFLLSWGVLQA